MSAAEGARTSFRVLRPSGDRLVEAVGRLVGSGNGDPGQARRFIEYARRAEMSLEQLWSLTDATGRIVATALVVPGAGRVAMVFATRPATTAEVEPIGSLIAHASTSAASGNVRLVQALADPEEGLEVQAFEAGGLTRLATLRYLERQAPRKGEFAPPLFEPPLRVVEWSRTRRRDMIRVLEATYLDTLDCPGLCGMRRTEDILDGHLASGRFVPGLWSLLYEGENPVGVMLLSPSHVGPSVELVYFGLAPSARGRGLGRRLLQYGLARLAGRDETRLTLAVDEANAPALRLYDAFGFRPTIRRAALVRPLVG